MIVTKIQFYAIELARNREGHNSSIRHKFKPKPRKAKQDVSNLNEKSSNPNIDAKTVIDATVTGDRKEIENELKQILTGQHPLL